MLAYGTYICCMSEQLLVAWWFLSTEAMFLREAFHCISAAGSVGARDNVSASCSVNRL